LASSLLRVAADPESLDSLHGLLGGFCHKCRNALNGLKLSLYLAKRLSHPEALAQLKELESHYDSLERLFDRLQLICRPMAITPITLPLGLLIEERRGTWDEWMARRGRRLLVSSPGEAVIGEFDPNRLTQGLDALVAWRAGDGAPGEPARLRWRLQNQQFQLDWVERSAQGLDLDSAPGGLDLSESLALPLLARVISAHGGHLDLTVRDGLRIGLRWPVAVSRS
jgi:hypothetical protein